MTQLKIALMRMKTSSFGSDWKKNLQALLDVVHEYPGLDLLLAPEWYFLHRQENAHVFTEKERDSVLEKIATETRDHPALIIPGTVGWVNQAREYRNTAYLIYKGEVVGEYNKMTAGGDVYLANRCGAEYIEGDRPGFFEHKGIRLGLSVCADVSMLKAHGYEKGIPKVDLHLMSSCGILMDDSRTYARSGGYALTAEGRPSIEVFQYFERGFPYDTSDFVIKEASITETTYELYELQLDPDKMQTEVRLWHN